MIPPAPPPPAFFLKAQDPRFWLDLAPDLHISQTAPSPSYPARQHPPATFPPAGYLRLPSLLHPACAATLARAVLALRSHDIHPTFVYVYDEVWAILDALRPRIAPFLGADFEVLEDAWAFCVDPRTDRGGWPIHRGVGQDVRQPDGNPGLVNVWVALTDATERNACMHLVPLPSDPHYPHDLANLDGLALLGGALPTPAGGALVWNANAAHWGGACDPSFDVPRVSVTFTARAARERLRPGTPTSDWGWEIPSIRSVPTFRERLDLIARQLSTYGDQELSADRVEMRWATMVSSMRRAASRR